MNRAGMSLILAPNEENPQHERMQLSLALPQDNFHIESLRFPGHFNLPGSYSWKFDWPKLPKR
jgi:hypothetical protein